MNGTAPENPNLEPVRVNGRTVLATVAVVASLAAGYAAGASGAELDPGSRSVQQQREDEERAGGVWGGGLGPLVRVPGGGVMGQ